MNKTFALTAAIVLLCFGGTAQAQEVSVALPGASATTGILSGTSLVLVDRTVPAGYMLLYRAYDGSYRDPVVLVEGFDPMNTTLPASVYATANASGAIDMIRAAGRSVWVVNFGDGGGALTANAKLVSHAIQAASSYEGAGASVDVVGLSMGGVISRYALAYDEQYGGGSDGLVRLFLSGDSPQQGANAPISLQEIILFSADPTYTPLLNCDAALSLLYTSVRGYGDNGCWLGALPSATNWTGSSAAHDWFYSTLNGLNGNGYPHKCRNVAVSNGSFSPQPHSVGETIYAARTYFLGLNVCSQNYPAQPLDVAPGSLGIDFAPGNIRQSNFELDERFVATFIPTVSALDTTGGVSKFDRTLVQTAAVNHSTVTTDTTDFILEEALGPARAYNPKYLPDGANAALYDWIVTAAFNGYFYAESPGRLSGLLIFSSAPVQEGTVVVVRGVTSTAGGERRMNATSVTVRGNATVPGAFGMPLSSLGGGPVGASTPGITGGSGLNNVGLLVRGSGKVTQIGSGYLYIDDGSNLKDGTATGQYENIGVRVICDPTGYTIGDYVAVTGISSCFQTPTQQIARRIITRRADDVQAVSGP